MRSRKAAVANGVDVLDFWQAAEQARALVRGTMASAPATWARALDDYQTDLRTRGGNKINATSVRGHLTRIAPALLNKRVALLTAVELARWRNDLIENSGLKLSSVARLLKSARASLNHAANHDPRIENHSAWRIGLGGVHDSYEPVDRVLTDDIVRKIITEAYADDCCFRPVCAYCSRDRCASFAACAPLGRRSATQRRAVPDDAERQEGQAPADHVSPGADLGRVGTQAQAGGEGPRV
jgi:hypothetical protein